MAYKQEPTTDTQMTRQETDHELREDNNEKDGFDNC